MPIIPTLIIAFILLIPAIIFSLGKGADLISGYSLMSNDKKQQYNRKKLTKDMAIFLYSIIALIFIWHSFFKFGLHLNTIYITMLFIMFVIIMNIILVRKNKTS